MSSTSFVVDLTGGAIVDNSPTSVNLGVSLADGIVNSAPQPNKKLVVQSGER